MRKVLAALALYLLIPYICSGQSMGSTSITQGGHTAVVTAAGSLQVDLFSVGGTAFSGGTSGSLPVSIISGAGSGGTAVADEATFTPGTTNYTPAGCFFQTTSANNALTNLQGGWFQCTARRAIFTSLDSIIGTAVLVNNGVSGAGSQRVNIASDNTAFQVKILGNTGAAVDAAIGAAPPANALYTAGLGSGATGGFLIGVPVADTPVSKNITSATTTLIITGVSGRQVRVGSLEMYVGAADNTEFIEGTGATCGTNTTGMIGGATSGTSQVWGAAGGVVHGSGLGTVLQTVTAGESICLVTSTSANVGLHMVYTIY